MEYNPSCPAKNFSHKGRSGRPPLTRNKKATFGTRGYGVLRTFGAMDAHQNSSSSVMLCTTLLGASSRVNTTWGLCNGADIIVGGRSDGGGGDKVGGGGGAGGGITKGMS
jgi:hypothetical protein